MPNLTSERLSALGESVERLSPNFRFYLVPGRHSLRLCCDAKFPEGVLEGRCEITWECLDDAVMNPLAYAFDQMIADIMNKAARPPKQPGQPS